MSEEPVIYNALPEDLEPISGQGNGRLEIRIGRNALAINSAAYATLGKPERVDILLGRVSRMLVLRPTESGGRKISTQGKNRRHIQGPHIVAKLGLPPSPRGTTLRLEARLVEGALLVGPLPESGE
jgi:hypothetical protein